jgi:hypothetical protein
MRALGSRLGLKGVGCGSYLVRLEKGKLHNVRLATIVGYLKACNEPVGRFFLDLFEARSGEAEIGNWKLEIGNWKLEIEDVKGRRYGRRSDG